jgi:hypothetical protein
LIEEMVNHVGVSFTPREHPSKIGRIFLRSPVPYSQRDWKVILTFLRNTRLSITPWSNNHYWLLMTV